MLTPIALLLAAVTLGPAALLWWVGGREPARTIARGAGPAWLIALKRDPAVATDWRDLVDAGVAVCWEGTADLALIGTDRTYWDRFAILQGGDPGVSPLRLDATVLDLQVLRIRLVRPPRIALGLLRALHATGLRRMPAGAVDPESLIAQVDRPDVMPDLHAMRALLDRPRSLSPAMVNYLAYREVADYRDGAGNRGSGRVAYARYGRVALETVYRTGGKLLFYASVAAVLREPAAGPTAGRWDDVAAMQYPEPKAILTMEQLETYRNALVHRDAGLERTVVIATVPER